MKRFKIGWTEYHEVEIEAPDEETALSLIWDNRDYPDFTRRKVIHEEILGDSGSLNQPDDLSVSKSERECA